MPLNSKKKNSSETHQKYLYYLTDPSFRRNQQTLCLYHLRRMRPEQDTQDILSSVEIKDFNLIICDQNLFDQPVKTDIITSENIRKIVTFQGDD